MTATGRVLICVVLLALPGFIFVSPAQAGQQRPAAGQPPGTAEDELGEPQFPGKYDRLDASRDAYRQAETKRRLSVDRQMQLVEEMVWYSGVPGYDRYPPDLSTIYGYGHVYEGRRAIRRASRRAFRYGYPASSYVVPPQRTYVGVFEPWPLVPGDIYGYPYLSRVEQPLGHKVIRTGPNSYIYRPVYESDLKKPAPTPAAAKAKPEQH